jgi:hypothetical protein
MRTGGDSAGGDAGRRVTRFVADHEGCDGGFVLERRGAASGGEIVITCRGCGKWAECDPAHPGLLKLIESERVTARRRLSRSELERWLPAPPALPWWVPNAYIGLVILAGVALIAFGVLRGGESEQLPPAATTEPIGGVPAPAPAAVDAGAAGGEADDRDEASARFTFSEKALRRGDALERVVEDQFAIGKPAGWGQGTADAALVLFDPAGDAQVKVYFEAGERDLGELTAQARRFLAGEHRDARIGPATKVRVGGSEGIALLATYPRGSERALLLVENGFTYLALGRVDSSAKEVTRLDTLAALGSFQPL